MTSKFIRIAIISIVFWGGLFPNPSVFASSITNDRLITLTNQTRAKNGLSPLTVNAKLAQAASAKAGDLLVKDYFAHYSSAGKSPWQWILESGYNYAYAGENLAMDFNNAEDLFAAWLSSSTHRENILNANYRDLGLAVKAGEFEGRETIVVVSMFGQERPSVVAASIQEANQNPITITPTPPPAKTLSSQAANKDNNVPEVSSPGAGSMGDSLTQGIFISLAFLELLLLIVLWSLSEPRRTLNVR